MSGDAMTDREIDEAVAWTLGALGMEPSDFESAKTNLLLAEPAWPGPHWTPERPLELAAFIDHTALKPETQEHDIWRLCLEMRGYRFASVCVNSSNVLQCVAELEGMDAGVCCVVGFPLGAMATAVKRAEAEFAVDNGAREIDMVINIARLKSDMAEGARYVFDDIKEVVDGAWGAPVKVILETCMLSQREIVIGCVIAVMAGAAFVKTSTGFSTGGAKLQDVALMRKVVGDHFGVKASGGIRTIDVAIKMIRAGANRIGTSNGVSIVMGEDVPMQVSDY